LKYAGGLSTAELSRAFLIPQATMAQRLVRAKDRLVRESVSLASPSADEVVARLEAVLQVLYIMFNEGYTASHGDDLIRFDLCEEAMRLAMLLASEALTAQPRVHALLALMLFAASRFPARTDSDGNLLLLAEQDRNKWDRRLVCEAIVRIGMSAAGNERTTWHMQAEIASLHALAPTFETTDWRQVLSVYDELRLLDPTPLVILNRAVAVSMVDGPQAALDELAALGSPGRLDSYYLYSAAKADFLRRLGRLDEAAVQYEHAIRAGCNEPERRYIRRRQSECLHPPKS
jgi:RNA polymerase sigma-70 factor (ECF subfamily)